MEKTINRRNLSGVYVFHKFDNEEKRQPTCFEDCPVEKQQEWLNTLDPEAVKNLALHLASTLKGLGDHFDIINGSED